MPVVPATALTASLIALISVTSVIVAEIEADQPLEASLPNVKVTSPAVVILCNLTLVTAVAEIPVNDVTAFTPLATVAAEEPDAIADVVEPMLPDKVNV